MQLNKVEQIEILLVEDDAREAFYLRKLLNENNAFPHTIAHVETLKEAIEHLKSSIPTIILLDLPEPDASENKALISQCQKFGVPIVMLTNNRHNIPSFGAFQDGVLEIIPKDEISSHFLQRAIQFTVDTIQYERKLLMMNEKMEMAVDRRTGQLEETSRFVHSILQTMPDVVTIFDPLEKEVRYCNRPLLRELGYPGPGSEIYELDLMVGLVHSDDLTAFKSHCQKIQEAEDDEVIEIELRFKNRFDRWRWLNIRSMVFERNKRGQVSAFITIGQDVTRRKQLEALLRQSLEREKEENQMKSRLISIASHEFRNPLSVIQMSVSMLEKFGHQMETEQRRSRYSAIYTQLQRLENLMEGVLLSAKYENGRLPFNPQSLDIVKLCQYQVEELRMISGKGSLIEFIGTVDSLMIEADESLIIYILNNLLSNAVKYSPFDGCIQLFLSPVEQYVQISIRDEGIGIPQEEQKYLFRPFYRASNAKQVEGTGLGLMVTKYAVEMHQGEIEFTSCEGEGTNFIVLLPIADETQGRNDG